MLRSDNQGLRSQQSAENIGARSFDIVMKRVFDELSFEAPEKKGQSVTVDADYVRKMLTDIVKDQDLSRCLLQRLSTARDGIWVMRFLHLGVSEIATFSTGAMAVLNIYPPCVRIDPHWGTQNNSARRFPKDSYLQWLAG